MLANFAVVVPTRQTALYTRWQHICPVPDLHKHHPNLNLELLFSHLLCWAREKKSFRLHEKSFFFSSSGVGKAISSTARRWRWRGRGGGEKKIYMKNCGNGNHLQAASLNLQNSCFFAQQIFAQPTLHVSPPSFATPLVHRTSPAIALLCDFNVAVFFLVWLTCFCFGIYGEGREERRRMKRFRHRLQWCCFRMRLKLFFKGAQARAKTAAAYPIKSIINFIISGWGLMRQLCVNSPQTPFTIRLASLAMHPQLNM